MILLYHPTANNNVRHAAVALAESGQLCQFWTCVGWRSDGPLNKLLPNAICTQLLRRLVPVSLFGCVRYYPIAECSRLSRGRIVGTGATSAWQRCLEVDAIYRGLDRAVAREVEMCNAVKAVYAYEDGACETFGRAAVLGLRKLYELPFGYWKAWHVILKEERERMPEWADTLQGAGDDDEKFSRKDQELALADKVFVASSFCRSTLPNQMRVSNKVSVLPYGAPKCSSQAIAIATGKLRCIFVGALTQRKGISYLIDAMSMLGPNVTLTLIGAKPPVTCVPLERALKKHNWIGSASHEHILEIMRTNDVFVFPSLFEGFGLVILEALAQGLPVITTANTGGPDIISDGVDGFIVPLRSAFAIAEKLELL